MPSTPASPPTSSAMPASSSYERHKTASLVRSEQQVRLGQEIGPIPPVADHARRARADKDFRIFCETYFAHLFAKAWSDDHLRVIHKIERVVVHGECFALAMPRGSGKTTLCRIAVIWAVVTGRHQFVMLINGTSELAVDALRNIKEELAGNDLLAADYPHVLYPIRALDGETRKASGQRYYGRRTRMVWGAEEIVMPTIPGSRASGACIRTEGIHGNIRGALHRGIRPTLAIVDDPQTDQSARSPLQVHNLLSIINGTIAGLAGPGQRVAILMPMTVIRLGDVADQLLDRGRFPEWQGERTKLLYSFPKNLTMWGDYFRLRDSERREGGDGSQARAFYAKHRRKLESGAQAAWPARFDAERGEVSAIQHAMHLKKEIGDETFAAEYQNEPVAGDLRDELVSAEQIITKLNRQPRGVVQETATTMTAFIDVQKELLYYVVAAWADDFTGYVVDYGTFPDQKRIYFSLRDARRTLSHEYPGMGFEGRLYAALDRLTCNLLGREWSRADDVVLRIERLLIDANWNTSTETVYQYCRQSDFAAQLLPSHGKFVGASSKPMYEWSKKPGDRVGTAWKIPRGQGKSIRHIVFDTNYWKSFVFGRLAVPMGEAGCLSLFGSDPEVHRLFADHLTAEYAVRTEGRGRVVDEWKQRPERSDNHWLDCIVGAAVAASTLGVAQVGTEGTAVGARSGKRLKLSELRRQRR